MLDAYPPGTVRCISVHVVTPVGRGQDEVYVDGKSSLDLFSDATTAAPEPASSERLDRYRCEGVPGKAQVKQANFLCAQRWVRLAKPQGTSGQAHRVLMDHLLKVSLCAGLWKESGERGDRSADGPKSSSSWGHSRQYLYCHLQFSVTVELHFVRWNMGISAYP